MKKNKIMMLFLLVVVLLFSGCNMPFIGDAKQDGFGGGSSDTGFNSNKGVELSFNEGVPPSDVYKGQEFIFGFLFENHQQHDIADMRLKVSGFDQSYVPSLKSEYDIPNIPKLTKEAGVGILGSFAISNIKVDNFQTEYPFNPKFDYCYKAQTNSLESVCIPDKAENKCNAEVKTSLTNNGPLQVSVQNIINKGDGVRIFFTVQNKGTGVVRNTCFKKDYSIKFDVDATLGTEKGTCSTSGGEFVMVNNKASFHCDFARGQDTSYPSQAIVKLDYTYEQSVQKNILVKSME